MACAPSEDSDQPGHPPSLIRVFAVRMKKTWVLSYPLSAQRRLWSDWADAQADLSLRWAHFCWFCHEAAHIIVSYSYKVSINGENKQALLNLNIHTSYFSHAVNYSHEYVTFWYVWNIRTTNFEILIGTSFSQMSNFRLVKNSHVFVTPVNNSFEFFTCVTIRANSSHVWQIRSNVKVKWICHKCEKFERICHTCETFVRIFHRCDKYVRILHFCEGLARIFHICNTYAWHVW